MNPDRAPASCVSLVERALDAIAARDGRALRSLVADDATWETSSGEGGPDTLAPDAIEDFPERLRRYQDEREVKELLPIGGAVVVRLEGQVHPPSAPHGGTAYFLYRCREGAIVERRPFFYRKEILRELGLSRREAEGALIVRDDDDERLYAFSVDKGERVVLASYAQLGTSDHDHCGICWTTFCAEDHADHQFAGYSTLDGSSWLCPECFDEVKDHFALVEEYSVVVVVDPDKGEKLHELALDRHVWAIRSSANEQATAELRAARPEFDSTSGITLFDPVGGERADELVQVLPVVEEHHGQYAHDPPVGVLEIWGTALTDAIANELHELAFDRPRETKAGIVAIRSPSDSRTAR